MKWRFVGIVLFLFSASLVFSQRKEGLKNINGTQLFIKESGKGEVLIVIHGGPGLNHTYFLPHLEPLSKKMKVVYYDQRACGQSAIPAVDSLSMTFFIDDIEAIRKLTRATKINLLAHSWGALLAVQYGIKYPDHIGKMILSNPDELKNKQGMAAINMDKQDSIDRAKVLASEAFKNKEASALEQLFKIFFRSSFYDKAKANEINIKFPDNFMKSSESLHAGLSKDLESFDYYEDIKRFQFPVMVCAGRADNIPIHIAEVIAKSIPGSIFMVFDKSGHFPFIEEKENFNRLVTDFLRKN